MFELQARRGRLREKARNPIRRIVDHFVAKGRLALMIMAAALVVGAVVLLIVVSSAQAFLAVFQQSTNSTQGRLSLLAEREAESEAAAATDGANSVGGSSVVEPVGAGDTVRVYGIRVHHSIGDQVRDLIDAAEADGVALSGWGWRDNATQIRLRREHCGTTQYAIYQMPSSQCRPPTARPGRSQHERGLAIDFTYRGDSIGTRASPGFKWLAANAADFGLKNLASEPWHWSTTGR